MDIKPIKITVTLWGIPIRITIGKEEILRVLGVLCKQFGIKGLTDILQTLPDDSTR